MTPRLSLTSLLLTSLLPKPHHHLPVEVSRLSTSRYDFGGVLLFAKTPPLRPELPPSRKGEEEAPAPEGGGKWKQILDNPKSHLEVERGDTPTDISKHIKTSKNLN